MQLGTARRWLFILASTLTLGAGLFGCAGNNNDSDGGMDASTDARRRPDTSGIIIDDGGTATYADGATPGREVDPCGSSRERCCRGDACDLGLRCEEDLCCGRPGGGRCGTAADCCSGFICETGQCKAPEGSDCVGSSECGTDLACIGGSCTTPVDGCGVEGGACCAASGGGDPVCRSGSVCSDDGAMCETCGAVGQPCCDGAGGGCGSSTTALCISGDCTTPSGCGVAGMPCCMDSDEGCVRSAECGDDGMCTARPGAGEPGSPGSPGSDCGADGQSCCFGGECAFGSICESYLTNRCVGLETLQDLLGFVCGEAGSICCLPDFTCEGDLQCDLLFCSGDCTAVGDSCTEGTTCCDSSQCVPSPSTPTCCKGQGVECGNDFDCCGWMLCGDDGTCTCTAMGETCVDDMECCDGGVCTEGECRPGPGECGAAQEACAETSECCGALSCKEVTGSDLETQCCSQAEGGCQESADCCGQMLCGDGVCVCQGDAAVCVDDADCCADSICVLGRCAADTGSCGRVGDTCDPSTSTSCCGMATCAVAPTEFKCCAAGAEPCASNAECCGTMLCTDGSCQCKAVGESCVNGRDCCGAAICSGGTCT